MQGKRSIWIRRGYVDTPIVDTNKKKNPAIGMAVGAFALAAVLAVWGQNSVEGFLCSMAMAPFLCIVGLVFIVIAVGKANSNAR